MDDERDEKSQAVRIILPPRLRGCRVARRRVAALRAPTRGRELARMMREPAATRDRAADARHAGLASVAEAARKRALHGVPQEHRFENRPSALPVWGQAKPGDNWTIRLEMGQGGTVHLFIAFGWRSGDDRAGELFFVVAGAAFFVVTSQGGSR